MNDVYLFYSQGSGFLDGVYEEDFNICCAQFYKSEFDFKLCSGSPWGKGIGKGSGCGHGDDIFFGNGSGFRFERCFISGKYIGSSYIR